jgi:helicase
MNTEDILKKMNIKQLNDFQQKVLESFYNSSKNLLFLAPTGIGKTTIMEVLMINNALQNKKQSVYISPLRALSLQIYNELQQFSDIGIKVQLVTGESYIKDVSELTGDIIMTTYEKWDSVTRDSGFDFSNINLVILDELHNMRERQRSEAIELVLQWALQNKKRIITASATLGGIEKIQEWLDAEVIDATKRPIPLYEYVQYGNKLYKSNGEVITLQKDIIDLIVNKKGKNIMVFTNTRKRAEELAQQLNVVYRGKVAFFHGGLSKDEKLNIFNKVMEGKIKIIVSTTALGQGINLPFYAVLLKEMTLPDIENGKFKGWKEIDVNQYKQISGRAGRQKFDTEGIAIIESKSPAKINYYINKYIKGDLENIKSYLSLFKFILVTINRNNYVNKNDIIEGLKYTYSLKNVSIDEIENELDKLEELELIGKQNVNDEIYYYSLPLGRAVVNSYLDEEDVMYFKQYINDDNTALTYIIANSPQVQKISRNVDTVYLIEKWIEGKDENELAEYLSDEKHNFTKNDVKNVIDVSTWQSYAYYSLLKALNDKKQYKALYNWQMIQYGVPKSALNLVKLSGIGRKIAIVLDKNNIRTKREICSNINQSVEILKKNDMGNQVWRITQLCKNYAEKDSKDTENKIVGLDKFTEVEDL